MNFDEITRFYKRCLHFAKLPPINDEMSINFRFSDISETGQDEYVYSDGYRFLYIDHGCDKTGAGIIAHNYSLMQSLRETYIEKLLWIHELAAAMNRYIDAHKVEDDLNVMKIMRWWYRYLFFIPSKELSQ